MEGFCIGLLKLVLFIPECSSLKEKRKVILGIKTKLRNLNNISISEIEDTDLWQKAGIVVATVAKDKKIAQVTIQNILNIISNEKNVMITEKEISFL